MSIAEERSTEIEKRKLRPENPDDDSGIAAYLNERRRVLDRALGADRPTLAAMLRRSPPAPIALVSIANVAGLDRLQRVLQLANIEFETAESVSAALSRLARDTHSVLFTDQLDLIRQARSLPEGAVTHIIYVNREGSSPAAEAWRAGANDCMAPVPNGDEFWAHLTTARRILGLASSLNLALSDNRILSTVDALTGCGSRRFFEDEFPREVARTVRLERPLALVMCDIDRFKRVNDHHGHQAGDEVLSEFGDRLSHSLRLGLDWVARVGGEEFALVLPETSAEEAVAIAERLRALIESQPFETRKGPLDLTSSFGVASLRGKFPRARASADALIKAADEALYKSKRGGRNRVTQV